MRKIKYIIIVLLTIFVFSITNKNVFSLSNIEESSNIKMIGASIRTTGVQGLRFIARVNTDSLCQELDIESTKILKYGIVVSLGETTIDNLYIGSTVNNKKVLYGECDSLFNLENGDFTVVLYNISEDLYLQNFSARGYIKYYDGEEKIIYSSEIITRSIYEVAKKSLEENEVEYSRKIVDFVENLLCNDVSSVESVKTLYNQNGDLNATIKGVVTVVSTGSYFNATIEDETGAIVLFNIDNQYKDIIKEGNEVIISGKVTKYNGLYEVTNITNCKLLNSGVDVSKYILDVSVPFDSNELIYQGKIVSGFLKYISTSSKNMLFKTNNETSVLMYTDYKWSTFNSLNLETEKYYYVNGLVGNYNGIQLLPYSSDNAVLSIQNIEVSNLKDKYSLGDFSYSDLILKIILSDNSYQYVNVSLDMLEKSDLELLNQVGNHEILISYLGFEVSVNINLIEKNIKSINLSENNIKSFIGEELDLSGIKLNVIYEDNTINTIDVTKEMISGYDSSSVGEKVLSLNYQNYNLSVNYSILKPIVIYDIYAAGGNSGATYNRDFVVLYNNTNKDLELSEYKLAYATKSGTSFSSNVCLGGKIYANGYCVIAMTTGSNGVDLPFVNVIGSINAAASSARFALIKGEVPSSVTDSSILDNVFYEGLSATKSYRRSSLVLDTFSVITVDLSYLLEEYELVEVEVSGIKTKYKLGDSLDLTNAIFKAIYRNGASKILEVTISDIEGFKTTNVGSYKMTYIYEDFVLNIHYTVSSIEGVVDVEIFFIDLGDNLSDCGESTFIKVGNDIDILIDAGEHSTVSANAVMNVIDTYCSDNTLDYVIATHAHSDHIGGMRYVLPNYDIKNVIEFHHKYGAIESTKNVIGYYLDARLKAENIYTSYNLINEEGNGNSYVMNIADGVSFTFYDSGYLNSTDSNDKNEQSVICVFEAYGIRVLFNGDAEKQCEEIYAPLVGDVDIFKMPHHGTAAATSELLLQNITPEVAIACNGNYLGNEYGHPTYDALSRIYNYNPNMLVYAITGATIDSFEAKASSGAGSVDNVLYGYKSSKKYAFYFACDDIADTLGQRNGNINISISSETYHISSEFYNDNPIEIKQTDYWKFMYQYVNS